VHGAVATVIGPYRVKVQLPFYLATMRQTLAFGGLIQEASFAEAHPNDIGLASAMPIGTGPYMYSSFDTNDITLVRNPYYWGPKPPVDKLDFTYVGSETSAELAMRAGALQAWGPVRTPALSQNWTSIPGVSLHQALSINESMLVFNTAKPPFDDVHVRRAVAYCLDRAGLVNVQYGRFALVLKGLVSGFDLQDIAPSTAAIQQFLNGLPQYNLDLDKARAQLAQSAYPNGFTFTEEGSGSLTELNLQQNLAKIGITMNIAAVSFGQALEDATAGNFSLYFIGYLVSAPDPNSMVSKALNPNFADPNSQNFAHWAPPEVAQARVVALGDGSKADRWTAVKSILTGVADQVPYDPLWSHNNLYALAPGYTFTSHHLSDFDFSSGAWIWDLKATQA
jgi:peptide/nickel transport system substrate-binding protein